ncbi:lysylphosphatidylglycerol synthase transmembrane domain-containing protein [Marinivivus vitaminiproducens]|uniref:lysylphosphatidylglycerol synthase transmembrane domain-containing protein n=1 Tax=Marinivivus vitaminiproducens TaxID=3035935 RepID=UPI0027AA34AA|nr:YbhN family protein [Geminicoccaceae bacterium SCSIO 64248]
MKTKDYVWPVVGVCAVAVSAWLLYHELRSISLDDVLASLEAISVRAWLLAAASALVAYGALAGYDRIALLHLRRNISWLFISLCSFTAYALSHNIGASVLSGAVVRYRAYSSQGLSGREVGILVAFCSFTFVLGTVLLGGVILVIEPELVGRFVEDAPQGLALAAGLAMLALVALYVLGSWKDIQPLRLAGCDIHYPRLEIVARQLIIGPMELIGAAAIIYFALPEAGNPGYLMVLGIFLASFSAALLSHAPGGLGVLEIVFLTGLPEMDQADVLAALIVFRLLYLLIPFALSLVIVLLFERSQFVRRWYGEQAPQRGA